MNIGVEVNFVVQDSIKALALYESIFEVRRVEVTEYPRGNNEAVFTIYETRFHMLDENPQFMLIAPKLGDPNPIWFNVIVPDIKKSYQKAMSVGCTEIQPPTVMKEMGLTNAMFSDPFGYIWMLHQIHREVNFEERCKIMGDKLK